MKKILSLMICLSLLLGIVPASVTAEGDTCVRLSDNVGDVGYAAGTDAINTKVKETDGVTLIFDVLVESVMTPASQQMSQISAFSGSSNITMFDICVVVFEPSFAIMVVLSPKTLISLISINFKRVTEKLSSIAESISSKEGPQQGSTISVSKEAL